MILDIEMLRSFYASYSESVKQAKATVKRPLTYAEKVLFAHLFDPAELRPYKRGIEYVDFRPNRVAMQDATAQMALLQFMNAGKDKVAVPASVHCDHLIRADVGATQDLPEACKTNKEVYDFLKSVSQKYHIGFKPSLRAFLSLMTPWDVEITAILKPPRTRGSSSLPAYTRRPGLEILLMPVITFSLLEPYFNVTFSVLPSFTDS